MHTRAFQGDDIDYFSDARSPILNENSENNFRQNVIAKASIQQMYSEYDYPELPEEFEDILGGTTSGLCAILSDGDSASINFHGLVDRIKRHYPGGDPREFFYKYVLTLKCIPGTLNYYDYMAQDPRSMAIMYGNIMRGMFDKINPNAFIRIRREGKIFEGPIHLVYKHLAKYYRNSPSYRTEYRGILKRLERRSYLSDDHKSISEIRKNDPKMPLTLPMP